MSTKCLFKILYQMYLFLHRPQNNLKLEGFHLNGDKVPFQNTYQFPYRPQKNGKLKGFRLNGDQESFHRSQYTCSSNICSSLFWYICSSRSGHLFIEIRTSAHEILTSAHQILYNCYSVIKKVKVGIKREGCKKMCNTRHPIMKSESMPQKVNAIIIGGKQSWNHKFVSV